MDLKDKININWLLDLVSAKYLIENQYFITNLKVCRRFVDAVFIG
nr:MAG TPA: hypothetical protein [Caudoviricetes sp.]